MTDDDISTLSLQAAMDSYLAEISGRLSPQSQARNERLVRTLSKGLGGDRLLDSVTPLVLADYREKRLKGASASTVEKDFVFLSAMFDWAIDKWNLATAGNPVNSLGSTARTHGRDRRLRPGEKVRLMAACDQHSNPLLGLVVRIGLETALRKSEILALTHDDINLGQRVVVVPKSKTKAPRQVPLTQTAVQLFQEVLAQKERPVDTKLIFYGELGRYETRRPYSIDRIFRQILLTARLKAFRFSDLRFEAISRLREAGCSELEIIAIAGTRAIRGRRHPQQQIDALLLRLDALGIGTITADLPLIRKKPVRGSEDISGNIDDENIKKPSSRSVGRGSFGVPVGIRRR
jgi:integrase